jgi:hypothetical protein
MEGGGRLSLLKKIIANPRVVTAITAGSMLAFGVLYVGQVNAAATKGYAIRELQAKNRELRRQNERLDMQIAKLRSVHSVTSREVFLGFIPLSPSAFVRVESGIVAVR